LTVRRQLAVLGQHVGQADQDEQLPEPAALAAKLKAAAMAPRGEL
jgi:hypothetical protein